MDAKQYFGCGFMSSATNLKVVSERLDQVLEFEEWIAESFPTVNFRYIGANLVFAQTKMLTMEVEPGDWLVKFEFEEYPSVMSSKKYEEMMKGFEEVG
jgi:hypothetical protein